MAADPELHAARATWNLPRHDKQGRERVLSGGGEISGGDDMRSSVREEPAGLRLLMIRLFMDLPVVRFPLPGV